MLASMLRGYAHPSTVHLQRCGADGYNTDIFLPRRIFLTDASLSQMGITQTSFYARNSVVSAVGIRMDVAVIAFQGGLRIFPAPSRLILEITDVGFRLFDAAVNPHEGIRWILSSRFFQHLYMGLSDMQVFLVQQFLLQAADHMGKSVPVHSQEPVCHGRPAKLQPQGFPFFFLAV